MSEIRSMRLSFAIISTLLSFAFLVWANTAFDDRREWAPPPRTKEWMGIQSKDNHYIPLYLGEYGWPCAFVDKWVDERVKPPRPIYVWNHWAILIDVAVAVMGALCIPLLVDFCFKFWHTKRFQLHLTTIVLVCLVLGAILYLNITMLASGEFVLGWPYYSVLMDGRKWQWLPACTAIDLSIAVLTITFSTTAIEWLVRRREAQKP